MNEKEKKVLDLVVALENHKRWMRKQPWHGRTVFPREKQHAMRHRIFMQFDLDTAIEELLGPE
jgi:hypothetical protein